MRIEQQHLFSPKRVLIESRALEYPLGRRLYDIFRQKGATVAVIGAHNRVPAERGLDEHQAYVRAKRTLVIGVRKSDSFETCKPSAHYQLPLATSCPGMCEYCYLLTTLGKRPYVRVYVNLDEILERARRYIEQRTPAETTFEGAATSDPIPVEQYTGALARTIEFFSTSERGRFRFVTKFCAVEPLLGLDHGQRTQVRFSVNAQGVIEQHEKGTPGLKERIRSAQAVARAGYPTGFMVAPIILFPGWEDEYRDMFRMIQEAISDTPELREVTFEFVTHRFTPRAKKRIEQLFPGCGLPLSEEGRKFKFGQFGYGKYVYEPSAMAGIESEFRQMLSQHAPGAKWLYLV